MRFIKYHGLGNDFILLRGGVIGEPSPSRDEVVALCDRRFGIGADGVMLARPSERAALRMELVNSDGSVPEMCGNGIRCLVKYAVEELGLRADPLPVETLAGVLECHHGAGPGAPTVHSVRVAMGTPRFERSEVPVAGTGDALRVEVAVEDRTFVATGVCTGNPHMVIFGDAGRELAGRYGPALSKHALWPRGANVEFTEVRGPTELRVTVYERGCGLTLACGTGATAAACAAVRLGRCQAGVPIAVDLPGGRLLITVAADLSQAWMEGPATEVFRGELPAISLATRWRPSAGGRSGGS